MCEITVSADLLHIVFGKDPVMSRTQCLCGPSSDELGDRHDGWQM